MAVIWPTLEYEQKLWDQGCLLVAGVDEVGRGCLAGNLVTAAVVVPRRDDLLDALKGVRDSKTLSAKQRAALLERIKGTVLSYAIGEVSAEEIDRIGIVQAVQRAMLSALAGCVPAPDGVLVDAVRLPLAQPQLSFPKADALSVAVAAASILAKEHRDAQMHEAALLYPGYGFESHVGYGAPAHFAALKALGPCPLHRRSFLTKFNERTAHPSLAVNPEDFPSLISSGSSSASSASGDLDWSTPEDDTPAE